MKRLTIVLFSIFFLLLLIFSFSFAGEQVPEKKYSRGDVVSILVQAPLDVKNVVAVMPNGDNIPLVHDVKAAAWHGVWRIPSNFPEGSFRARIFATDYEGLGISSSSEVFLVEASPPALEKSNESGETAIKAVVILPTSEAAAQTSSFEAVGGAEWYKVRVGLFLLLAPAASLAEEFRNEGYDPFIVLQDGLWRVQLGAFKEKENAYALYQELREKGFFTDIVVTDI